MNKIVYLEGSRAVGKTTLLKQIKEKHPEFVLIDGYARKDFMLNNNIFSEFIVNEKLYLACDVAQHNVYKSLDTVIIVVKGPYTDTFFAETIVNKLYQDHDIYSTGLLEYIKEARNCVPDYIVYLDASQETILKRCENDDHVRVTMKEFLTEWLNDFRNYYLSFSQTKIIHTDFLSKDDVYHQFMTLIGEKA